MGDCHVTQLLAVEADLPQVYETRVAYERLAAWSSSGKNLARLTAGEPYCAAAPVAASGTGAPCDNGAIMGALPLWRASFCSWHARITPNEQRLAQNTEIVRPALLRFATSVSGKR